MIRVLGDSVLREKCLPATLEQAKALIPDFVEAWQKYQAVGIAAPQIGSALNVFFYDSQRKKKGYGRPVLVINPTIDEVSEETTQVWEGCLSCPKVILVERPKEICWTYTTELGSTLQQKATGLEARVVLHEFDHLLGKLILDYAYSQET